MSDNFSLNVFVVSKDHEAEDPIIVYVMPHMKIADLKTGMFKELQFPLDIQKWIINGDLRYENDVLSECGLRAERKGQIACVYLLKENEVLKAADAGNVFAKVMSSQEPGRRQARPAPQPKKRVVIERDFDDDKEDPQGDGWSCQTCTFVNPPDRPGCTVCSSDRPAEYVPQKPKLKVNQGAANSGSDSDSDEEFWPCPTCTFINSGERPSCEQCATDKPAGAEKPRNK